MRREGPRAAPSRSSATSCRTSSRARSVKRCPTASWRRARRTSGAFRCGVRTSPASHSAISFSRRAERARAPRRMGSLRPRSRRACWARPQGHRKPLAANRRNEYRGLGQTIGFRVRTREPFLTSILCDRTVRSAAGFRRRPRRAGRGADRRCCAGESEGRAARAAGRARRSSLPGAGYGPPGERDAKAIARAVSKATSAAPDLTIHDLAPIASVHRAHLPSGSHLKDCLSASGAHAIPGRWVVLGLGCRRSALLASSLCSPDAGRHGRPARRSTPDVGRQRRATFSWPWSTTAPRRGSLRTPPRRNQLWARPRKPSESSTKR